jgi:hypothetical protein
MARGAGWIEVEGGRIWLSETPTKTYRWGLTFVEGFEWKTNAWFKSRADLARVVRVQYPDRGYAISRLERL